MHARHTLKCDIYKFNRLRNRCYRYTTFQLWCGFSISIGNSTGNATEPWILVHMHMANVGINKTATSDRLDLRWQLGFQWHRRGIELVFKSRDCFTKWLFHSATIFYFYHFFAATYVFVVWNFTKQIARLKSCFVFDLVGEHSAPIYLLSKPYTDL